MGAKAKVCAFIVCFAATGVCASPLFADFLPMHGGDLHLDSGDIPVGISPMAFTALGNDDLDAPLMDYAWEIHVSNAGGLGDEEFNMAVVVETPAGPIVVDAGTATVPPLTSLYWDYHMPDPFGETAPLAVRMSYTKPRIGMVPLVFHSTITECSETHADRTPPPPFFTRPGSAPDAGSGAGLPDFVFTLTLPETMQAGDHNGDGIVDAADYVAWLKTDATPGAYGDWRSNFGEAIGLVAAGPPASQANVPEPTSALLLIVAAALRNCWRRRNA